MSAQSREWMFQHTGLINVQIGPHRFEIDPQRELLAIDKRLAKHRDDDGDLIGDDFPDEIVDHMQETHGIRIGRIAASSYYWQLVAEHQRIHELFFPKFVPDGKFPALTR